MTPDERAALAEEPGAQELLWRVADLAAHLGDMRQLADQIAELVRQTSRVDAVCVFILQDDERTLALAGATPPFDDAVGRLELALGEGITGWVASRRTAVALPADPATDPRWRGDPQLETGSHWSMASTPMTTATGELVGVLNAHTEAVRDWSGRELALLGAAASTVAGVVHTARLLRRLELGQLEQRALSERLVDAEEQERSRLARELHDGVAQRIAALSFYLSAAQEALVDDPAAAAGQLARAVELVGLTAEETRSAVRALRPPLLDDLGLEAGLRALARDLPGLHVRVDMAGAGADLSPVQETALYRVVQEALHNVVKHARAQSVHVRLARQGEMIVLEVHDDGHGRVPLRTVDSHGLASMRDRARLLGARLEVTGRPGAGTTVRLVLPAGGTHGQQVQLPG